MVNKFKESLKDKTIILIGLVIAGLVFYFVNPFGSVELTKWDRSISPASMSGISIGKRVLNIYLNYYVVLPLVGLIGICAAHFVTKDGENRKSAIRDISFLNIFMLVAAFTSRFASGTDTAIIFSSVLACALTFIIAMVFARLTNIDEKYEYDDYIIIYVNHIIISLVLAIPFHIDEKSIKLVFIISTIATAANMWILKKTIMVNRKEIFYSFWEKIYYGIALWVCAVEAMYLLAERGCVISHPFRILAAIILAFGVTCLLVSLRQKVYRLDDFSYLGAIIGVGALSLMEKQYKLFFDVRGYANLFEVSNSWISLETMERYKIPIIDYFSAHALQDGLSNILYWIMGGDSQTAVIGNPWHGLSQFLTIILLYYVLKQVFGQNWAVLTTLVFPFIIQNTFWGGLPFIAVIGLLVLIRNDNGLIRYVLFWLTVVLCCLSRYDSGISIGVSCVITVSLLVILKNLSFKKLGIGFLCVSLPAFIFYVIYSRINSINWLNRIDEWMNVGLKSSGTWATISFGNPSTLKFFIIYELFPIVDVIMICITIVLMLSYKKSWNKGCLALVFSLAYALMVTRTLVFHNLDVANTGSTGVAINYFPLALFFFSVFVCDLLYDKNTIKREYIPMCALGVALSLAIFIVGEKNPDDNSTVFGLSIGYAKQFDVREMMLPHENGEPRVELSEYTESVYLPFEHIFDELLTEDQTFADFANVSGLYALTRRKYPCYVSQTPSLLTNNTSQRYYIEEIKRADAPLVVITNKDLDFTMFMQGIRHNIRYYKTAEYFYANYRPLVLVGEDFALWCENEKYEQYYDKLCKADMINNNYTLIEPGYDADTHHYELMDIPFIWANMDVQEAVHNGIICQGYYETTYYDEDKKVDVYSFTLPDNLKKEDGQYICLEYEGYEDQAIATLEISENGWYPYEYNFSVKPGTNNYMIRISSDNYWFFSKPNIAKLSCTDGDGRFTNVRILKGD